MSNYLVSSPALVISPASITSANTNSQKISGGTRALSWSKQKPSYHQRTNMLKTCGKKCFLGPRKSFPICTKNTCKRNRKGILSAYIRAQEYKTIRKSQKYRRISAKAYKLLHKPLKV